jgi:hypothetical protein
MASDANVLNEMDKQLTNSMAQVIRASCKDEI